MSLNNPETLDDYLRMNELQNLPTNETITLYKGNHPYEVFINENGQTILPGSDIIYKHYLEVDNVIVKDEEEKFPIIYHPQTGTIGIQTERLFTTIWKKRTGHHRRSFGLEYKIMKVQLSPEWEFDQDITHLNFFGNGLNLMILNIIDAQSFTVEFADIPTEGKTGKCWEVGPYDVQMQTNLKIKLA